MGHSVLYDVPAHTGKQRLSYHILPAPLPWFNADDGFAWSVLQQPIHLLLAFAQHGRFPLFHHVTETIQDVVVG